MDTNIYKNDYVLSIKNIIYFTVELQKQKRLKGQ